MATSEVFSVEGIVLSRLKQKEHDAYVHMLTDQGLFSVYVRGALKIGTAFGSCSQEYCLGQYVLARSAQGNLALREGKVEDILLPEANLEAMLVSSLLSEFCLKALQQEEGAALYPWLKDGLLAIKKGFDPLSIALLYLSEGCRLGGYSFDPHQCASCGEAASFSAFDPREGGFLCENCRLEKGLPPSDETYLRVLSHAFKGERWLYERTKYPRPQALAALRMTIHLIQEQSGAHLHSLDTILYEFPA